MRTAPTDSASIVVAAARPIAVIRWLWTVVALIVAMVVVGGITRLTESGLSITEWKPVTGAIPPLNDAAWQAEFAKYKATTEYAVEHRWMALDDFKRIFFWEWFHRLIGRVIGLAFALPLAWFAWKRAIPKGYGPRLIGLLLLGGLQGVIGWWMVTSGLAGRTDVSHYRLAVHLTLALIIIAALVWTARDLSTGTGPASGQRSRITTLGSVALALLFVQIVWGALTAGLNAGFAFSTWPMMGDALYPADGPSFAPRNWIDAPVTVQFIHRWLAFVAGAALALLGRRLAKAGHGALGFTLVVLVVVQISLGITTLLTGVHLHVAVSHQGVAALLVIAATWAAHTLANVPPPLLTKGAWVHDQG